MENIPYELAISLKKLGFDELTNVWRQQGEGVSGDVIGRYDYYNRKGDAYTSLPTFSHAFKWFREKYGLCLVIKPISDTSLILGYNLIENDLIVKAYTTYEKAEIGCLERLIEKVKDETKINQWEISLEGKNVHSVLTKCFECGTMGCNMPQVTECGNCGNRSTVRYYDSETINQNLELLK